MSELKTSLIEGDSRDITRYVDKIKYKSKETAINVVLRMLADRKYEYLDLSHDNSVNNLEARNCKKRSFQATELLPSTKKRSFPATSCCDSHKVSGSSLSSQSNIIVYKKFDTDDKCYLFLNIINKFSRSKLEEYMSVMQNKSYNHIIVLYDLIITSQAKKILNSQSDITIELFKIEDLVFNIPDHHLVPKHTRLCPKSDLYKKLFEKYGHNLSKILINDPISKYYFYKLNDIIEIERKDGSICYRIVSNI